MYIRFNGEVYLLQNILFEHIYIVILIVVVVLLYNHFFRKRRKIRVKN